LDLFLLKDQADYFEDLLLELTEIDLMEDVATVARVSHDLSKGREKLARVLWRGLDLLRLKLLVIFLIVVGRWLLLN